MGSDEKNELILGLKNAAASCLVSIDCVTADGRELGPSEKRTIEIFQEKRKYYLDRLAKLEGGE